MQEQKLIWDDSVRLMVTCMGKIYALTWIEAEDIVKEDDRHPDPYVTGWYYDEDGPPSFMGVTKEEAVKETRKWFGKKQQIDHWEDHDLLYAMCAVLKRLDLMDQGDERTTVRDTFLEIYGEKQTDLALDLIYQKVLE